MSNVWPKEIYNFSTEGQALKFRLSGALYRSSLPFIHYNMMPGNLKKTKKMRKMESYAPQEQEN